MSRHLKVPSADTFLDCNDSEGTGHPILFLNGAFGTQRDWRVVLRLLGGRYRTVTFDERARGKSGTSRDYSFAGCLDDISAIVSATGVQRPLLVAWSHGAALAVRYTAQHPGDVAGLVLVDGAFPIAMLTEADKDKVRRDFRRMAPLMRVLAASGRSARMSAEDAAELNIELNDLMGDLGGDYDTCPVEFTIGSKRHIGSTDEQVRRMRASIAPLIEQHPNISLFATVASAHTQILSKHPDTIVAAVDDLARRSFPASGVTR